MPPKVPRRSKNKDRVLFNENDNEEIEYEKLTVEINNLDDLIKLGKSYNPRKRKRYNIDLRTLSYLVEPLEELQSMIGLKSVKENIVNQIMYFLQNFHDGKLEMLHTVIQGSPGVGKTALGKILAKIYLNMGILRSDRFFIAKRSDLIGRYLGHTADKTQRVINSCNGGVLFIDEAYSLGDKEGRDSFSKECLDTLNQNLSENRNNFMCIIAGYENALNECFFSMNEGLERRFNYRFTIEPYEPEDLRLILVKLITEGKWKIKDPIEENLPIEFFKKNKFKNQGGDMETLFINIKMAHSRRVFSLEESDKKIITKDDLEKGHLCMNKNTEISKKNKLPQHIQNMFI
jgi:SpoVK/Ycf46/Vps4 family AAA+-type ATPase